MDLYNILLAICSFFVRILYRIEVVGQADLEENRAYIIASNHTSLFDPIVLAMVFKGHQIHFLGKKELFKPPLFDRIFKNVGVIPVDRSKNDITAVKNVLRLLKSNRILGIFPQGTRVKQMDEDQSKAGLGMFALKTGADIVPVTIQGQYKFFSKVRVLVHDIYRPNPELFSPGTQGYLMLSDEVMDIIRG